MGLGVIHLPTTAPNNKRVETNAVKRRTVSCNRGVPAAHAQRASSDHVRPLEKAAMEQILTTCRHSSVHVVLLILWLLLPSAGFAEQEIAVLTIRTDNIHESTSSELLPIARIDKGNFKAIDGVEDTDTLECSPKTFAGWERAGTTYDVLYRGGVIGSATTQKHDRGGYSCSALCVVTAATKLIERAPGIKTTRRGFDSSGSFDESITQYVASTTSNGPRPYSTRIAGPVTKSDREALEAYAKGKLAKTNQTPSSRGRVLDDPVTYFLGSKDGEVNVFFTAAAKGPNGDLRAISSVVRRSKDGVFESLFELIEDGNEDHGSPSYEMVDAVDFDEDGTSEMLVIYHNYEFHEFQILRRVGSKFEVVHKGPSYGC
jgi:hypothetical protein